MRSHLKVYFSFDEETACLTDTEKSRLLLAMVRYARDGADMVMSGNERFLWPVFKAQIDRDIAVYDTKINNGSKGGRPANGNRTKPNETENNRTKPKETETPKIEDRRIREDIYIDDDNARAIQADHDRVIDAAEDAGFAMSNDVRAALIRMYADHGLDKVLAGLKSCVMHGAPNLAYLEACMTGGPKTAKGKTGKVVSAQQYAQRDYAGEQEEAMKRMIQAYGN